MIYVSISDGQPSFIHNLPFDEVYGLGKTAEELKQTGILVESLPEAQPQEGQDAFLKYSETEGLYYEYVDRPPSPEEELDAIRDENAELMFRSAMQEMDIVSLKDENAELMFRLANLEMGGI